MTSICQDVEAVLRHARARHPDHDLVLLAPSLSARAALRALAAVQDELCGAILLLPVMEVMDTIRRASGSDLLGQFRRGELDPNQKLFRVVEHDVAVGFGVDAFDEGWVGIEGTVRDLCAVRIPLLGIAAERDAWVDVEDVAQVFSQATNQQRVVLLQATSHDLAHNLPVMRQVMTLVLEEVERVMGLPAAGVAEFVDSLDIDEIVTVMRQERELASDDYAALAAAQVGE